MIGYVVGVGRSGAGRRLGCGALAAAGLLACLATAASAHDRAVTRRAFLAVASPCVRPPTGPLTYHYPIRPFDRQHPIRGFFGDPRTLVYGPFGRTTIRSAGSFTFHNGIDIVAATGTPVFPVVSGVVDAMHYADEVSIDTADGRSFQYFHIAPRVHLGEQVVVDRTVLGVVERGWHHVHLTEIDGFRVHNPLDPGHLEPYRDRTAPSVDRLVFRSWNGHEVDAQRLDGRVFVVAEAEDIPPLPAPGAWFGAPTTPAYVGWRLRTPDGRLVLPETAAVDFRRLEPPNRDFWQVYAAGTYQNFPVFGHHLFFHRPGRYLFNLAPAGLDTSRLADGTYRLTVTVRDVCGNGATFSESIKVTNRT